MATKNRFTTYHTLSSRDVDLYISLEWDYYPGCPATYHDPEEPEQIELAKINVPDHLESRREEVKWLVEDNLERLQDEAAEQINSIIERWRVEYDADL